MRHNLSILGVPIALDTVSSVLDIRRTIEFFSVYLTEESQEATIVRLDVTNGGASLSVNGRTLEVPTEKFAQVLEDTIRQLVVLLRPESVFIHAACLVHKGGALLLIGSSCTGKTTLSLRLAQDELELYSDDTTPLCLKNGLVQPYLLRPSLRPYTRELSLAESWRLPPFRFSQDDGSTNFHTPVSHFVFLSVPANEVSSAVRQPISDRISLWSKVHWLCTGETLDECHQTVVHQDVIGPARFNRSPKLIPISKTAGLQGLTRHLLTPHPPFKTLAATLGPILNRAELYRLENGSLDQAAGLINELLGQQDNSAIGSKLTEVPPWK